MTGDEMQRAIDFIVEQEAKSSAKIEALADAQKQAQKNAEERWARTEEGIRALLAIAEIHEREFAELREAGLATDQKMNALREASLATDERLSALINVVERQISERRNGKS